MSRVNQKMKKFNLRGVLDNLRSSVSTPSKAEWDVEETLRSDHFQVAKTVRHGFPHQPTCLTFDPVQNLLAIGTRSGSVRIFGRPGVDCHMKHDGEVAVIQILFLVNEGAMVTACTDDQLHLWTLRQKKPEIVHSLKFQRERITCAHLPFRSKWLYVGTERGNVHVVNIESFILSGYVINWNKAIELSRKTHPGQVIHLSDNPADPNKLLIGFEGGTIVLWDLKTKTADMRYNCPEVLRSISWHHEGKQFMCSHGDGSLTTWNTRIAQKPQAIMMPHAKIGKDGKPEPCKPIPKVQWLCTKNGESYVIFSGGMPMDKAGRTPTLTVMHAKSTTVLEMEHHVVDFLTLNDSPWNNDFQDPYGIVVLLQNDLVVVDLNCPGYPCFENPYPMDLHESPVTACLYVADCAPDLIPAFYSVGSKQKKTGFSEREWPIKGGQWGQTTCSYSEIMITGHADGSLKFWDASAVTLQVLYKLKTAKIFDKAKCQQPDAEDDPFAIQQLYLDPESRYLISVGLTHFVLFKFSKQEAILDPSVLEISIVYEIYDELESPELEYPPAPPNKPSLSSVSQQSGSLGSYSSSASDANTKQEPNTSVRVKGGTRKWSAGYQPELCCILTWIDGDAPPPITNITLNSSYGLLAFGNECGLAVVDIIQKTCLLNLGTPDLYGSMDPYSRAPRSPKNKGQCASLGMQLTPNDVTASDECKSPTTDQLNAPDLTSPKIPKESRGKSLILESISETKSFDFPDSAQVLYAIEAGDGSGTPTDEHTGDSIEEAEEAEEDEGPPTGLAASCASMVSMVSVESDTTFEEPSPQQHLSVSRTSSNTSEGGTADNQLLRQTECEMGKKKKRKSTMWKRLIGRHDILDINSTAEVNHVEGAVGPYCPMPDRRQSDISEGDHEIDDACDGFSSRSRVSSTSAFVRKVSKKIRGKKDEMEGGAHRKGAPRFEVIDLSAEDVPEKPPVHKFTYLRHLESLDKSDGSFCRSRSSSMSSLENISKEAIECLQFADSYTRKTDSWTCPCLWVGTSLGSVLVISLNLPEGADDRRIQPVIVSPSGTIFRLKGSILALSFLDCNGFLIPSATEQWQEPGRSSGSESPAREQRSKAYNRQQSMSGGMKARMSPTSSTEIPGDRQFAIMCSEKHARVVSLPTQACAYKVKITDTSIVAKAEVTTIRDSVCLACYLANGHIMTFSLPSLKPLLDVDFLPSTDVRIAKTFCFSNNGHALYFCSPSEVQKITLSAEICDTLSEMLGELFLPCDTPEAPKQSFFKNLFGPSSNTLDREELFGEEGSGKASKTIAKYTAGMANAQERAAAGCSEIAKAKMLALERGEKLGELEDRTAQMRLEAEAYSQTSHQLMAKFRDKKWYQF